MFAILCQLRIWKETDGQDIAEFALMAGLVALTAAAFIPNLSVSISGIFGSITAMLNNAAVVPGT